VSLARRIRTDFPPVLLRLLMVGTAAVLTADAVNQWALSHWRPPAVAPAPPQVTAPTAPAGRGPASFAAITRRHLQLRPQGGPGPRADAPP
jgi:hypothetical protein